MEFLGLLCSHTQQSALETDVTDSVLQNVNFDDVPVFRLDIVFSKLVILLKRLRLLAATKSEVGNIVKTYKENISESKDSMLKSLKSAFCMNLKASKCFALSVVTNKAH